MLGDSPQCGVTISRSAPRVNPNADDATRRSLTSDRSCYCEGAASSALARCNVATPPPISVATASNRRFSLGWKRGASYPEPAEGQPRETLCEKGVGLQPWFLVAYVFVGARHILPGIVSWRRPAHRPRAPFGACSCGVRRPACRQAGLPPLSRVSACRNAVDEACLVHNTTKPTHRDPQSYVAHFALRRNFLCRTCVISSQPLNASF